MPSTRRAVTAIVGGSAGGQLIALACSPVISRLVPPAAYGPFAVINAAVLPLATVAAWRLEMAIPLPEDDDEALDLAAHGLRLVVTFGVLLSAVAWFLRAPIARLFSLTMDPRYLVWIPTIAASMGAFMVLNQLAIRWRMYGAIARRNVLQAGVASLAQVGAAAAGWGAHGLAFGLAVGQMAGVVSLAAALRHTAFGARSRVRRAFREVVGRHRRFPLLLAPSGLLNSLGLQAPVLLAAALYGTTVSGWLGMTQRVLALPVALIGLAIAQVYLGEFSAAKRSRADNLDHLFLSTSRRLLAVGVALGAVIMVAAPWLFSVVLGHQWRTSGVYAQALAAGLVAQMVASPLSQTLIVMERLGQQLTWDTLRLALCCGAVLAGHALAWGATATVWALGTVLLVSYLALWFMAWAAVRASMEGSPSPLPARAL